jgi:hypothetical protein
VLISLSLSLSLSLSHSLSLSLSRARLFPKDKVELRLHVAHSQSIMFLSARKADLKKGFQHLVLGVVVVVVVVVVGTRVKKRFLAAERDSV